MPETLTCAQCQELLPWYISDVPGNMHDAIAQHLATCRDCLEVLREWQLIATNVRDDVANSPTLPATDKSWAAIHTILGTTFPSANLQQEMKSLDDQPLLISQSTTQRPHPTRIWSKRLRAIISVAALVTLFAGVFAWYHAEQHPSGASRPTNNLQPTPNLCAPTKAVINGFKGITIAVDHALADLSGTDVYVKVTNDSHQIASPLSMRLTDCMGNIYSSDGGSSWGTPEQYVGKLESQFSPLPAATLGKTVTLYLSITDVTVYSANITEVHGLWQIPFTVQIADHAQIIPIHTTSIKHEGLTITPTYVAWLQGITTAIVILGTVRVHLHLTGMPQGASPLGFQYATPPGLPHSSQAFTGNLLQLHLPNGQLVEPSFASFVNPFVSSATGEGDIDVDFDIPSLSGEQTSTLMINSFVLVGPSPSYTTINYPGPWIYQIPNA